MKHFRMEEFRCRCGSGECRACGGLPPAVRDNIEALVTEVLDPARHGYGGPVVVNSGYRCARHNRAVGGVEGSQHVRGEAADVCCSDNERLAKVIVENGRYDQLIRYMGAGGKVRFIHVSWKRQGVNRKQMFNRD